MGSVEEWTGFGESLTMLLFRSCGLSPYPALPDPNTEEWIVMALLVFDTLKATKVLKQAGFDEVQAEAVVATVGDAIGGSVATKADLEKTAGELHTEIQELSADMQKMEVGLRADLEKTAGELRADMQKVEASLHADMQKVETGLRADMTAEFRNLYRHLWIMAAGIIGLNVALMKLIP